MLQMANGPAYLWQWAEPAAWRGVCNQSYWLAWRMIPCDMGFGGHEVLEWNFWERDIWPKLRSEKKKVFPVCKLLFSSLGGYVFEPVCLVVCLTFSLAFCTSILNLEHLNLCLNNTFAEAMLHGENPWPGLGRKAWTSPWWITWAWPSWETNHVNHSVDLLSWVLILHSCPVVELVTCVHSLQCILKHLGSSRGVFGSTFGPFVAMKSLPNIVCHLVAMASPAETLTVRDCICSHSFLGPNFFWHLVELLNCI